MDHWFQMDQWRRPPIRCSRATRRSATWPAQTESMQLGLLVTGVTYRHPGLLAKIVATLDVLSGGRAQLGIGAAWYGREHDGPRGAVPADGRALRAPGGDAADLPPDVERRRRPVRRSALPAGGDDLRAAADLRAPPVGADRRQRGAQDAAPRRPLRRRVQPVRRPRRPTSATRCRCCATTATPRAVTRRRSSTRSCPSPTRSPTSTRSSATWPRYARCGIETVVLMPSGDPVAFVERVGAELVPRLAEL